MTSSRRALFQWIVALGLCWFSFELAARFGMPEVMSPSAEPHELSRTDSRASSEDGAPTNREPRSPIELRTRPDSVIHYEMDVSLDPETHVIRGTQRIRFRNASRVPIEELWLHLYLNAFENDQTIFWRDGQRDFRGGLGLTTEGGISVERFFVREHDEDLWPKHEFVESGDRTDVRLPLSRAVAPSAEINIDVIFSARLPNVVLRTGFAGTFHMVGQWFPKLARLEPDGRWAHFPFHRLSEFYADFADWDVRISVPRGYEVGATGETVSDEVREDKRHLRFKLDGAIDFAFTAWDGFVRSEKTAQGIKIITLYPRGYDAVAARETEAAIGGLRFFGETFGAYPYPTLTIVHPPDAAAQAGGMEYPSLITTGGPRYLAWTSALSPELLTLHELAHQWFYGIIATNEHAHPFLDEGLTSYAADLAAQKLYGDAQLLPPLRVAVPDGERLFARGEVERSIDSSATEFQSGAEYGRLVYYRSATILHTIDRVFQGASRRAVRRYALEQRFLHPSPAEFFASFETAARAVAVACFSERCVLDLSLSAVGDANGRVSARVFRHGEPPLPVEIAFQFTDGSEQRRLVQTNSIETNVELEAKVPLRRVILDPEARILIDGDLTNNARALTDRAGFAAVLAQGFVLSQVAAALGLP